MAATVDGWVLSLEPSQNSKAILLEDGSAGLRKDIGLNHGDKIHVDDLEYGANSVLAKLVDQVHA